MRIALVFLFPTLVLACALSARAAKTSNVELSDENPAQEEARREHEASTVDHSTIDIATPPPARRNGARSTGEYFYPFRRAITLRLGKTARSMTFSDDATSTPTVAGVQMFYVTEQLRHIEGGADLFSDGTGALYFFERLTFTRSKLRPYVKWGIGLIVLPRDQLATFAKYNQYMAMGSVGAEYLVRKAESVRLDFDAGMSMKGLQTNLTLGYVFAW